MTFFRIEYLFFIWAVPVLLVLFFYGMRRRDDILARFSSTHGLNEIVPERAGGRRWTKAVLLMGAVLFGSVALAGPKYGYRWQEIRRQGVDLMIALDCSRSMTAADISPTRLERAKREVFDLLSMLQGDRVGLVAFAGTAFLQCPLTLDYNAFNLFLNTLTPDYLPVGGTDITGALETAMDSFDPRSSADKAIILITDGENTGTGNPVTAAERLKEREIKLFCIGVGGGEGVPIPEADGGFKKDRSGQIVLSKLDETTLKQMAVATGGTYVRSVAGDMDLEAIYSQEIRKTMQADTLESGRKQVWEDRFQVPLALALVCLVAELMLPVTRKKAVVLLFLFLPLFSVQPARANETIEGIAAYDREAFETALKHFTDAQLNDPERPELLYNVGNAYYKTGNFDAAAAHYGQALATEDKELKKKIHYNLGNTEFRRGNLKNAIEHYESVLSLAPDDTLARENLEFVKKILEQQQQQPSSGGEESDSKKEDSEEQSESKDQPETESGKDQQDVSTEEEPSPSPEDSEQEATPEFGEEMDEQQAQQGQQPESPQDQKREQQAASQERAEPSEEPTGEEAQAERMLNRLKDQPGRALMPSRGPQQVERDW